ncbi:MAG: septal ring lytic transglycosylase RlpA family protein [Acidobacteriota bacterium]|nr:septal ring lytic transglycosylase RlpA family protein [Acidobacteriota bacterium]
MKISIYRVARLVISFTVLAVLALARPAHNASTHSVTGTAVYYSDKMNGKSLAAKGEKYDSSALTAATHGGFPLGSTVKVTNLSNQKSVLVKVNDRMNPKSKSVIDLSRKAAEEIDLIHAGHARVKVELTGKS